MSNKAFPWLTARHLSVRAAGLLAMRVNFVGELGYELHHPIEMQNYIFDALMEAGAPFGIKPFGIRAMDSLRLEKSYKLVGRELSIEYAALESGLDRFVDFDKGPFLGRDALVTWCGKGFENKLVTLEVHGVTDADARGSEPVTRAGAAIGRTTSGGYGWRTGEIAGAGDGEARVQSSRVRGRRPHSRRDAPRRRHRRQPLRFEEREAESVGAASVWSSALRRPALLQQGAIDLVVAAQARHSAELVDEDDRVAGDAPQRDRRAHLEVDRRDETSKPSADEVSPVARVRLGQRARGAVEGDADRPVVRCRAAGGCGRARSRCTSSSTRRSAAAGVISAPPRRTFSGFMCLTNSAT